MDSNKTGKEHHLCWQHVSRGNLGMAKGSLLRQQLIRLHWDAQDILQRVRVSGEPLLGQTNMAVR